MDTSITGGETGTATNYASTVSGGCDNDAGTAGLKEESCSDVSAEGQTVVDGIYDRAESLYSSILGGYEHITSGKCEASHPPGACF